MTQLNWAELLNFLDGRITNAKEMLNSEGFINAETRLRLEGEYETLKNLRTIFQSWSKET